MLFACNAEILPIIHYRKIPNEDQVMLGAKDVYEPRCRICYKEG